MAKPARFLLLAACIACLPLAATADPLAQIQTLLDAGDGRAALQRLDPLVERQPKNARVRLLRSTALFLVDRGAEARLELDRALELDPTLRQGWLNQGALRLAEGRNKEALTAFRKARELDPAAEDNDLNLGATLLLLGRLEEARGHFDGYLAGRTSGRPEAEFLIAKNYALSGYGALATEHLRRAIRGHERFRVLARTDASFEPLLSDPRFQKLLAEDSYRPPADAYRTARTFAVAYDAGDGRLLGAVLDALGSAGMRFDPRVEVTASWALIWTDELRIKVSAASAGQGRVEITAERSKLTQTQWQQRTDSVFTHIPSFLHRR